MVVDNLGGHSSLEEFKAKMLHGKGKGSMRKLSLGAVPGYEFVGLDPHGVPVQARIFVTPKLCYWVWGNSFTPAKNQKFVESFRLLKIGIDPTRGAMVPYSSATGVSILGALCPIRLEHPDLGSIKAEP